MASRLQSDDAKSGQANWADIEDDDEDWAPDTITWKDGTKIAIPHTEEQHPPPPVAPPAFTHAAVPAVFKENGPPEKPLSPAPSGSSPSVKSGVLASGKGLVLKGAPEKPTLVAKPPPPPAPVKSPWATLPKIDKQPPLGGDTQHHQLGSKFAQAPKDGYPPTTLTPPPPKEIAADDFSRSLWREGPGATSRELFNSQSGRYEPVTDRRGSLRPDPAHSRQPALLQRSSQAEQQGPAEPSAAFQTSRTSDQHVPYGRRRGSSNVSGGSGSYQHLRSKTLEQPFHPSELTGGRRPSLAGESDSPTSPSTYSAVGPGGQRLHGNQPWPRASPSLSHATPHQHGGPDEGQNQSTVPPVPGNVTEQDYETQKRVMRLARESAMKRRLDEEAREEAARKERIRLKLEAMGPAPESNSAKKAAAKSHESPAQAHARVEPAQPSSQDGKQPSESTDAKTPVHADDESDTRVGSLPSPDVSAKEMPDSRAQAQSGAHAHPWQHENKSSERYSSSSSTWSQPTGKNVWGAPNNNRSLGNGTFNSDLGASQISQIATKSGPGPIGPPSNVQSGNPPRLPPIGPPNRAHSGTGSQMPVSSREATASAWSAQVQKGDAAFRAMLNAEAEDRDRKLKLEGRTLTDLQPQITDTWRPTKLDADGRRVESTTKESIHRGPGSTWAAPPEAKLPPTRPPNTTQTRPDYHQTAARHDPTSSSMLETGNAGPQPSRGSRFFPSKDSRHESAPVSGQQRPKSPSPPPPDMAGHPAFDGDVDRPQVSLPRQKPIVRLPPAAGGASSSSSFSSARGGSHAAWPSQPHGYSHSEAVPTGHHTAHSQGSDWEAKIKGLFDDRRPPKPYIAQPSPALDSFPLGSFRILGNGRDGSVTSRVMAEECFEEQEMGSLPPIHLPTRVPEMAWQPSPAPKNFPRRFLLTDVLSRETISFDANTSGGGNVVNILFPGMSSPRTATLPFTRTRSNPRPRGGRGGRHSSQTHRQGKGRDASSSYNNTDPSGPNPPATSHSSTSSGQNRRGGYRGRDNWSRNTPTPIQT